MVVVTVRNLSGDIIFGPADCEDNLSVKELKRLFEPCCAKRLLYEDQILDDDTWLFTLMEEEFTLVIQYVDMPTAQEMFWKAAREGDVDELEALIKAGVDVNEQKMEGGKNIGGAIHFATRFAPIIDNKAVICIRALVKAGADVNAQTAENETPYDYVMWDPKRGNVKQELEFLGGHRVMADPF